MAKYPIVFFLLLLPMANLTYAAKISGNTYDLSLIKINDVIIDVNSTPKQSYVAKSGSYYFEVPNGVYLINAELYMNKKLISYANTTLIVNQDGNYISDLILFPSFSDEDELSDEISIEDISFEESSNKTLLLSVLIISILFAAISYFYFFNRRLLNMLKHRQVNAKENVNPKGIIAKDDLEIIMDIIKEEGGRATQKDIRKKMPHSEAKISLMIAELEHKDLIDKIKKGRGNLIILKNK